MKITLNVLALAVASSFVALAASAQSPVPGSNAARAPLPMHRPADYNRVLTYTLDGSQPAKSVLIANHIGGPTPNEVVAVDTSATAVKVIAKR